MHLTIVLLEIFNGSPRWHKEDVIQLIFKWLAATLKALWAFFRLCLACDGQLLIFFVNLPCLLDDVFFMHRRKLSGIVKWLNDGGDDPLDRKRKAFPRMSLLQNLEDDDSDRRSARRGRFLRCSYQPKVTRCGLWLWMLLRLQSLRKYDIYFNHIICFGD